MPSQPSCFFFIFCSEHVSLLLVFLQTCTEAETRLNFLSEHVFSSINCSSNFTVICWPWIMFRQGHLTINHCQSWTIHHTVKKQKSAKSYCFHNVISVDHDSCSNKDSCSWIIVSHGHLHNVYTATGFTA